MTCGPRGAIREFLFCASLVLFLALRLCWISDRIAPMPTPPRRRWFQFGLRTMFVVVTVLGVPIGWVAHNLHWIRQRNAWRDPNSGAFRAPLVTNPPGRLGWFGETGEYYIELKNGTQEDVDKVQSLFPEARVASEQLIDKTQVRYFMHGSGPRPAP